MFLGQGCKKHVHTYTYVVYDLGVTGYMSNDKHAMNR